MRKEKRIADWQQMYRSMTDPEEAKRIHRQTDLQKRRSDKMLDTGL